MFDYQKLRVYQESLTFLRLKSELMADVTRIVAANDHLKRAAESISLNISHASNTWSAKERINYIGIAYGSALECAAALDIHVVKELLASDAIIPAKKSLKSVVSMLINWEKSTGDRLNEERAEYTANEAFFFDHETLDVYRVALEFNGWIEREHDSFGCSGDLLAKVDKSATSMVLNIAEGNGRFSMDERKKFLGIARKANMQAASLLDIAATSQSAAIGSTNIGRQLLVRVSFMLNALEKSLK